MTRFRPSTPSSVAMAVLIIALAAVVAACGTVGAGGPTPSPKPTPTPVLPTPTPGVPGSPAPTPPQGPTGGIRLDTALGHDIYVVVTDGRKLLTDARTGTAADGMSVRWGDAIVRNLDPKTVEVTWAGYPRDEVVDLIVSPSDDGVRLLFRQAAPYPNTDAMGADRVIVLTFAEPVTADEIVVEFTTAG